MRTVRFVAAAWSWLLFTYTSSAWFTIFMVFRLKLRNEKVIFCWKKWKCHGFPLSEAYACVLYMRVCCICVRASKIRVMPNVNKGFCSSYDLHTLNYKNICFYFHLPCKVVFVSSFFHTKQINTKGQIHGVRSTFSERNSLNLTKI